MAVSDLVLVIISVAAAITSIVSTVMSIRLRRRVETNLLVEQIGRLHSSSAPSEEVARLAAIMERLRAAKSAQQTDAILAQMKEEIDSLRAKQPETRER